MSYVSVNIRYGKSSKQFSYKKGAKKPITAKGSNDRTGNKLLNLNLVAEEPSHFTEIKTAKAKCRSGNHVSLILVR